MVIVTVFVIIRIACLLKHFNDECSIADFSVQPIEKISGDGKKDGVAKHRKLREAFWMKELKTVYPYGLNDRCNGFDWSNKSDEDITCLIFNKTKTHRKTRSKKK